MAAIPDYRAFGALPFMAPTLIIRVSASMTAAAWGSLLYQLISSHRRTPARLATRQQPEACTALYRSELERERDYLRRIAIWLPIVFSASVAVILARASQFRDFGRIMTALIIIIAVLWAMLVLVHIQQDFGPTGTVNASAIR